MPRIGIKSGLSQMDLFKNFSKKELDELIKKSKIESYKKNEIIFKEGDKGKSFYVILEGKVGIYKLGKPLNMLGKGEFFGEMAIIDDKPRSATCKSLSDKTRLLKIDKEVFIEMILNNSNILITFLKVLSDRLRASSEKMVEERLREERMAILGKLASTIVHDLKTPIAVIKGYVELLAEDEDNKEKREYLDVIKKQILIMKEMLEEILEFSAYSHKLKPETTELLEFVRDVAKFFRRDFRQMGVEIRICGEKTYVNIDREKMRRVFLNLFENARDALVDVSEGKIEVDIVPDKKKKNVTIKFKDNGKGIPGDVLDKIFEPFFSYGKERGSGLGLTIVKKIIEDHRGSIDIKSTVGKGTEVIINLPLAE
ncbi:hypothetical protein DRN73_09740 [Candidatus Pacearchaeota archaeon]|nr:MAG: hypothetical protein DRN73_09740 [Candidatus Pacearchaeota archaeon]